MNYPAPDLTEIQGVDYFNRGTGKWGYKDGIYQYLSVPLKDDPFRNIKTRFVFGVQGQRQKADGLKETGFVPVSCGRNWQDGHTTYDAADGHVTIWWQDTGKDEKVLTTDSYLPWKKPPEMPEPYEDQR